ncbi:peroxiredoxin [beta proteobacterium AAP99]|nr:peroxiredoxin [beta proteobacterium AAP99]
MTISVGNALPAGTLYEFFEVEKDGCSIGPNPIKVEDAIKGKKIVIFGLPGAYTPTCSAKHLPGYVTRYDALRAKGVDEIWCLSVNDAFVMHAWGKDQGVGEKVRMMGDGSATYSQALGLTLDLTARGMGLRSDRYAMIVDNGAVTWLGREAPGKFEVSSAESVLAQL